MKSVLNQNLWRIIIAHKGELWFYEKYDIQKNTRLSDTVEYLKQIHCKHRFKLRYSVVNFIIILFYFVSLLRKHGDNIIKFSLEFLTTNVFSLLLTKTYAIHLPCSKHQNSSDMKNIKAV